MSVLDSFDSPWFSAIVSPKYLGTAAELAKTRPGDCLTKQEASALALDFATALAHIHGRRIVHCDLHANNLLVEAVLPPQGPHFVLCDFGRAVHLDYQLEPAQFHVQPQLHRAPELFFARGAKFDVGSQRYARPREVEFDCSLDTWAYACTVVFVASGKSLLDPWLRRLGQDEPEGPSIVQVLQALISYVGLPSAALQRDLGWTCFFQSLPFGVAKNLGVGTRQPENMQSELYSCVQRCLNIDPRARPSMNALAEDLRSLELPAPTGGKSPAAGGKSPDAGGGPLAAGAARRRSTGPCDRKHIIIIMVVILNLLSFINRYNKLDNIN